MRFPLLLDDIVRVELTFLLLFFFSGSYEDVAALWSTVPGSYELSSLHGSSHITTHPSIFTSSSDEKPNSRRRILSFLSFHHQDRASKATTSSLAIQLRSFPFGSVGRISLSLLMRLAWGRSAKGVRIALGVSRSLFVRLPFLFMS